MEFPDLGVHCAVSTCKRLDFLPFECDACHGIFCKEHQKYEHHNCRNAYTKDVQVPVCPLCNQPVPVNRGEDPNNKVDQHIRNDCQSDKAKKLYTNRCSYPSCKKKELVPVNCNTCRKNFCLKHRFESDHNCQGHPNRLGGGSGRSARPAARSSSKPSSSSSQTKPQSTTLSHIGAELHRERMQRRQQQTSHAQHRPTNTHMSEDEALAQAIAASMADSTPKPAPSTRPTPKNQPTIDEDEALARAIAASLNEEQPKPKQQRTTTSSNQSGQQRKQDDNGCTVT